MAFNHAARQELTGKFLSCMRQRPHPLHFLFAADPVVVTESCVRLGKTSCGGQ